MNKRPLPALAMISALIAMVLMVGCFVRIGLDVFLSNHSHGLLLGAQIDGGRVRLDRWWMQTFPSSYKLKFDFDKPKIRFPDAKRLLWEFDAKTLPTRPGGDRMSFAEFPVWIALLPCVVAPIIWLKNLFKKPDRGFPIMMVR